jgi:glycosyltransferase involved in cell wall biosynthesis
LGLTSIERILQTPTILHVPYTFFPDACGGTEVYVRGLAQRLASRGYLSAVTAPGVEPSEYVNDGLPVYRFATDRRRRLELAYGFPDEIAAEGFRVILRKTRPRIVHLHGRTSAISELLVDAAHESGAAVVFTYHTPTVSCARGTMMLFGQQPCDGFIEPKRCTVCTLAAHGVPKSLARLAALVPNILAAGSGTPIGDQELLSFLRIPALIADGRRRFCDFISKVDHVVAVCQWVREVLERNGVPPEKITLSRQGLSETLLHSSPRATGGQRGLLRIAYFGRIDRAKGPDLLARALKLIPKAPVQVDIFAVRQTSGPGQAYDWLAAQAHLDSRLTLRAAVAPDEVIGVMAEYDLIAVPSRWLETGPLVVLEAFAAGVPVLGADLGGIAELVGSGVDGFLVPADDAVAWAAAIVRFVDNPRLVCEMRSRIKTPRSMDAVVDDMAMVYSAVVAASAASIGAGDRQH